MVADRPLLVVHDEEEGHLVYDLLVADDEEEIKMVAAACSPQPVALFPSPTGCRAFAASGGAVLGASYDFLDTVFHDTVMQVGGYGFWERQASPRMRDAEGRLVRWWPKGRRFGSPRAFGSYRDAPAMLPLLVPGDAAAAGTVIRMDTILFDGIYGFEKLRLLPGGCSWHAVPLPKPPVGRLAENELAFVSAYCAVGTRVWISVTGKGTFSLDAADEHSATWRTEGTWQLPFQGRGLHVPELGSSVIGLTADDKGFLCECDVRTGAVRHVWLETLPWPRGECVISSGHGPSPAALSRSSLWPHTSLAMAPPWPRTGHGPSPAAHLLASVAMAPPRPHTLLHGLLTWFLGYTGVFDGCRVALDLADKAPFGTARAGFGLSDLAL